MAASIAILASGAGSNAINIYDYFKKNDAISIAVIITNNPNAGVIPYAKNNTIPIEIITKKELNDATIGTELMRKYNIDYIILAGFLLLIPPYLIQRYPNQIINIHPSLLPKHGGKGMYGKAVHEAVVAHKDTQSGITIHYVNEQFDAGEIIAQRTVDIPLGANANEVEALVRALEMKHFPNIIEQIISKK